MSSVFNTMGRNKPDLLPVLEEHNHALQLCSRIRKGLERNVELNRIRAYADWCTDTYLEPHFEIQEKYIFPVLGNNVRVKRHLQITGA